MSKNFRPGRLAALLGWLGLALAARGADGDITAVEICPDGWSAQVSISGLSTGGTYAERLGLGEKNNPATGAPMIVFTVTSLGFDDAGNPTTLQRTVYGTEELRKPYPDQATNQEELVAGGVKVKVALSDTIFAKDQAGAGNSGTDVTYAILAGFYTESGKSNLAASGTAVNSSAVPYQPAVANWTWPPFQRITGPFKLRCVAFHRSGQQGRPVRLVKFTATDGTHTVEQAVTAMSIDPEMSALDQQPTAEYVAELDPASFDQGAEITCNFTAYPWVGDNPFETSVGAAQPTPLPGPVKFLCDKAGTYGVTMAKVDPVAGNDDTGAAYNAAAYNYATAAPFLTIAKAARAIRDYNSANRGRDDVGAGVVELAAGSHNWLGASISGGYGSVPKTWLTVRPGPGVARSDCVIAGLSGNADVSDMIKVLGVKITAAANNTFASINHLWFAGCEFDTAGTAIVTQSGVGVWYATHNRLVQLNQGLGGYSVQEKPCALIRGNDWAGMTKASVVFTALANRKSAKYGSGRLFTSSTSAPTRSRGYIFYNNAIFGFQAVSAANIFNFSCDADANDLGCAIVQNLFEYTAPDGTPNGVGQIGASEGSDTNTPLDNFILWHNLFLGQRVQFAYNSDGSIIKYRRYWSIKGNYWDVRGLKTDTFGTPDGNRTGNWQVMWMVGSSGNIDGGVAAIAATGFDAEYSGLNSLEPEGATIDYPRFVDTRRWDGVNEGDGFGDYHVQADSPFRSVAVAWVLPYDLDGDERGNGDPVGAYTYPQPAIRTDVAAVDVPEGGANTFQVKLSDQPAGPVTVTVARTAGDTDITVQAGASLNFTTGNWDSYQTVTLAAAEDADTTNGSATFTCSAPDLVTATVTASEADNDTTLTVVNDGHGTAVPAGATVVTKGVARAIAATPDANWHFVNWTVASGSATFGNANAASTTATISAPATVVANFAIDTYLVTFDLDGKGTRTGGGALVQAIAHGSAATAPTVTGNLGWSFTGWDVVFNNITATLTVTAQYVPDTATLTIINDGHGTTVPAGATVVTKGVARAIAATADPGYHFVNWTVASGAATFGDANSANTTATITADTTVRANFAADPATEYTATFIALAGGTVDGVATLTQTVAEGTDCAPVTAVADADYEFVGWTGDVVSAANPLTVTNVAADLTVFANFAASEKVAVGARFEVSATEAGLVEFTRKPKVWATYCDPVKDPLELKPNKATAKVHTKIPKDAPVPTVAVEWLKKVRLYNLAAFKGEQKLGTGAVAWLTANPVADLDLVLHAAGKEDGAKYAADLRTVALACPRLDAIEDMYGSDISDPYPLAGQQILLTGRWFGAKPPKVWLEYPDAKTGVARKCLKLKVLKSYDFANAAGKPAASVMDPVTGESRMLVQLPEILPAGITALVVENGVGLAAWEM